MLKCGITGSSGNLGKTFLKVNNKFRFIKFNGNITKKKEVDTWIKKNEFDVILHFAAIVPTDLVNKNYSKARKVNFIGTKYLVDSILKNKKKIKWFFFASTSHVYPVQPGKIKENFKTNPSSKYGKTKLLAENYVRKKFKNLNFCIGRIFSIIDNKGKGFLASSLKKKLKKTSKLIFLENLNHYRDFIDTKQISFIIIYLWQKKINGIINIATGKKTNVKSLTQLLAKKMNKNVRFKYNKPTSLVADVSKLLRTGYKQKKLNLKTFFK